MSAYRGGSGKGYGGTMAQVHAPKKKVTVSYVIRDEEEPLNRSGVNALRIDPNTQHLYSAGRDSIIRCWDISSQDNYEYVHSLEHHTDWVNDIILCIEGQHIMSASSDITLKLWDARRGACTSTLRQQQDYIKCLAYSKEREQIASGSLDHTIYVWDLRTLVSLTATNNKVTTTCLRGQKDSVYSLAMNDAGTVIVAGGTDKVLQVWDPRTDEKLMKLKGHTDNVRALLLSPDGTTCVSGSSDGTVRLWSLGQQRCIETFRMHEEGVWTLAADEKFQTIYSSGRDKKVYAIELNQGGGDGSLLFIEAAPVLCMTRDPCDPKESLWVSTTEPHITKWTFDPDATRYEEEEGGGEGEGEMETEECEDMEVTDIDEYSPVFLMKQTARIPGGPSIREYRILGDRQHVLTRDSNGHVQLWDVLHAVKEADLGEVDIDEEIEKRKCTLYTPNWFSVEIKTGMLSIKLSENDCFSAWVMGANAHLDTATPDLKLNLGALQLRALFEHWPSAQPLVSSQEASEPQRQEKQDKTEDEQTPTDKKNGEHQGEDGRDMGEDGDTKNEEDETKEVEKSEKEQKAEDSDKLKKETNEKKSVTPAPKLEQVMSECDDVEEWVELGAALHTPQSELDNIEHSHRDNPARCRRELFKLWLKASEEASWEVLAAALESSGNTEQAERVRSKYLTTAVSDSPPTSPSSISPPTTVSGGSTDKVNIKFFSVPLHTPVILAESGDCATTLVRMLCKDASGAIETRQLNNNCPIWVMDIVCQRKLPEHHKMNFSLTKYVTGGKGGKSSKSAVDRLSAQDVVSVRKVLEYIHGKMESKGKADADSGANGFEILCQDQVLDLDLDLRTVRYKYWKSGGDMKLFYREAEQRAPEATAEEKEKEKEGEGEGEGGEEGGEANGVGKTDLNDIGKKNNG